MHKSVKAILDRLTADPNIDPSFARGVAFLMGAPQKIYRMPPGECAYCDEHLNDSAMPPHDASDRCENGKHNHCTCDTCY